MKTIICVKEIDESLFSSWDSFINNHPEGTIFQSPHYFKLFSGQKRFKPVAVLIEDDLQAVVAVLSGIIQYQLPGPLKNFTSRCIVMGGPLVKNNDPALLKIILNDFDKLIRNKVIYAQFRNLFDMNFGATFFTGIKYTFTDHLNFLVDLTQPEEILWKGIHKQKRYEIKRSVRDGLTFAPITTLDDLKSSYELLRKIYKRIKLPIFPFHVFEKAFHELKPKGLAAFYATFLNNELVGTMYTLCYNGRIYDYFAGADYAHSNKFPNSLISWNVMLWGKNNGMTLFDWGGAGKPGIPYGVRDFKSKFGGQMVNHGRYEKIHKPILYQLATFALKLYKKIK